MPIYKKGDREHPGSYRGINLPIVISKTFNKTIGSRPQRWLNRNEKISEYQTGFREYYGARNNLAVLNIIKERILRKKRRKLYLCFSDYRTAFGSVSRRKLWERLKNIGIFTKTIKMIQAIYKNVKCQIGRTWINERVYF